MFGRKIQNFRKLRRIKQRSIVFSIQEAALPTEQCAEKPEHLAVSSVDLASELRESSLELFKSLDDRVISFLKIDSL